MISLQVPFWLGELPKRRFPFGLWFSLLTIITSPGLCLSTKDSEKYPNFLWLYGFVWSWDAYPEGEAPF